MTATPITDALLAEYAIGHERRIVAKLRKLETDRAALIAALERIATECERPVSNGVRLSPEAMLTALERYARATLAQVQS